MQQTRLPFTAFLATGASDPPERSSSDKSSLLVGSEGRKAEAGAASFFDWLECDERNLYTCWNAYIPSSLRGSYGMGD